VFGASDGLCLDDFNVTAITAKRWKKLTELSPMHWYHSMKMLVKFSEAS
jgi:hypothetical protein